MNQAFVDTNIVLRFLTGDPPEMATLARALFAAADEGQLILILDEIVVAEVIWVLESFYKYSHTEIAGVLQELLSHERVQVADKPGLLAALSLYATKNIDLVDALVGVHMEQQGIRDVFSFDRHFDRLPNIRRLSPGQDLN